MGGYCLKCLLKSDEKKSFNHKGQQREYTKFTKENLCVLCALCNVENQGKYSLCSLWLKNATTDLKK
jgi:hypothetical protein